MNKKCQIFTPEAVVEDLLDSVEYKKDLFGKKVIDTACGDGNMLVTIVKRYVEEAIANDLSISDITEGLEKDIYGIEIDFSHYKKCMMNLDMLVSQYGIKHVKWKILNKDSLKTNLNMKFDFVIGNPPYIKYSDLDNKTRGFIKAKFSTCTHGKFDYCYAFIEHGLSLLNEKGKMAFLIPNSIFKNVFAQKLREELIKNTIKIIDFKTRKLFNNALTSSAFIIIDNNINRDYIVYSNVVNKKTKKIKKVNLSGKWVFTNITKRNNVKKYRFEDYFKASITIATLYNKAYVLNQYEDYGEYYKVNDCLVEKSVVRVAASPRGLNSNKKELIIFPYYYKDNVLKRYKQKEFEEIYPKAVEYLLTFSKELSKRKSDISTKWFEYGRSQALAHLNQSKLLISTVVTKTVKVYELSEDCIPYSGIYITPRTNISLDKAKKMLESEDFLKYVQGIGINASGNSLRITSSDINNYEFFCKGDFQWEK
ncbi:MAG: SAM-dependent methyltransferase [Maledivibacter sp.]|jgi:type I restriction-modification system DNA methylase subunit|nr:SAM-dependent methyltransferase [Maledivibacter sp.]